MSGIVAGCGSVGERGNALLPGKHRTLPPFPRGKRDQVARRGAQLGVGGLGGSAAFVGVVSLSDREQPRTKLMSVLSELRSER